MQLVEVGCVPLFVGGCQVAWPVIEPGELVSYRGERLKKIPTNQWGRVEIRCRLGDGTRGAFDLPVCQPMNGEPLRFEGLAHDSPFRRLDCVGFVSRAKNEAVHFIDNIEIRHAE